MSRTGEAGNKAGSSIQFPFIESIRVSVSTGRLGFGGGERLRPVGKNDPKEENKHNVKHNYRRTEGMSGVFNGNPALSQAKMQNKETRNHRDSEQFLAYDSIRLYVF